MALRDAACDVSDVTYAGWDHTEPKQSSVRAHIHTTTVC